MRRKSCFIMGLPAAGKTTFLAALWYCLQQQKATILSLKCFSGNQHYLDHIQDSWLKAEKVSRTNIHTEEKSLTLTLSGNDQHDFEVTFPDLSGETFQKQYKDREIEKITAEFIRQSDSLLLFINPSDIQIPYLISDVAMSCRTSSIETAAPSRNPSQDDPIDVQLVELMQFVTFLRDDTPVRLGIIVSAWDTIPSNEYDHPETLVRKQLPLLWQYLKANHTLFDVFFFGVSAQGNALESEEDKDIVSNMENQMDRIIVVNAMKNISHDITLPLWAAVSQEGEEST